jgi:hypothetical protein
MKHRIYAALLSVFLPMAMIARIWQATNAMDDAGFYLPEYSKICGYMNHIALVICLLFLLAGRFWLNHRTAVTLPKKSILMGVGATVLAVSCVPQGMYDLLFATTENQQMISMVLTGILCVCFVVVAIGFFTGRSIAFAALALPVVARFGSLIFGYAQYNGIAQISENIISILFSCSFLIFCLAHCRGFAEIEQEKGNGWLFGSAALTAIFGFLTSVPYCLEPKEAFPAIGLGAAVYALLFLYSVQGENLSKVGAKHLKTRKDQ